MRRLIFLLIPGALVAQQTVAPTNEPVDSVRGTNTGEYNVLNSFETGWRFAFIGGDLGKYRSDVNYRNGLRLLSSSLEVHSREGHGKWFDEILLNTLGLGNDPYQAATLRVEKNNLYRYDMQWRLNEYYNPGLPIAAGVHLMDTRRRLQDHELTIFPQSRLKFRLGYGRNTQDGPALSSIQAFDARGDIYPIFAGVRREQNEYRLGAEAELAGFHFIVMHRWDYFKEDTPYSLDGITTGPSTTLTGFSRSEPYHGSSPGWFGNIYTTRKFWSVNGRITYVGGRRNFILDELAIGSTRFGGVNRQVLVNGDARRPVTAGDFSISLFPGERFTVTNNTSVHSTRIDGNAFFTEYDFAVQQAQTQSFNYLGVRAISNATDANYRAAKWLGFFAGYRFTDRTIRVVESLAVPPVPGTRDVYEQENRLHAGLAGIRISPVQPVTINLDGEVGRADGPFTPVSERNYHALSGRVQYRTRRAMLAAAYRQNYNNNSVTLFTHSAKARNYSANGSWTARKWLSLDAAYSRLHLDTVSGLAFFASLPRPTVVTGQNSLYISNIHSGNFGAHFDILKRVDLYTGYAITKDTGDGRASAVPAGVTDPISQVLLAAQTFPLTYQTPLARVSVRITAKVRWNAGWQFYRYNEDFGLLGTFQNYRAQTGYTSVLWSF